MATPRPPKPRTNQPKAAAATAEAKAKTEQRPLAGATRAASSLEIERIRFLDLRVSTGYTAFDLIPTKIRSKSGFTRPLVERKERRIRVVTTFLLRIVDRDAPAAAPAFELRAKTELVYQLRKDAEVDATDLDEFARVNAPFNAWPYWRELVRSALSRLDLPVFQLPLFRVTDAARLITDEQTFDTQPDERT
jgi:hypothetical protein